MNPTTFKRGATFAANATYAPGSINALASLAGGTITSQVRRASDGGLVADLVAQLAGDGLSFTLTCADTSGWALGLADWDVRITIGGTVVLTDTVPLQIAKGITTP